MTYESFYSSVLPGNYALTKSMELTRETTSGTLWYTKKFLVLYYYVFLSNDLTTREYIRKVTESCGDTQISVELKTLKDEVVKSLLGTSNFDSKMLQEIFSQKELELKSKSEEIENAERELATLKGIKQHAFYLNSKMQTWSEDFDTQEIEGKKSMLFQVVDRIELFKDRVEIIINIKMDMHKNTPTSEEISNAGDVKCVSIVKEKELLQQTWHNQKFAA